ncbi:uncharacterized protein LOC118314520 isoform X4 [Scophthalmus maximus]|uniref:uncharacterized protein LOC118314520 isoform X4 n=1 Tax=Scophthalmus maximus TaxID=52904 RepID=UPI001FA8D83C|nr:uncharacterized protein LOC118314520 isoform X4 [Scophthalmus maximus]
MLDVNVGAAWSSLRAYRGVGGRTIECVLAHRRRLAARTLSARSLKTPGSTETGNDASIRVKTSRLRPPGGVPLVPAGQAGRARCVAEWGPGPELGRAWELLQALTVIRRRKRLAPLEVMDEPKVWRDKSWTDGSDTHTPIPTQRPPD